jgi:hypothetical protein
MRFQTSLYICTLAIGIPVLIGLWVAASSMITSRVWQCLLLASLIGLVIAPTPISLHGPTEVYPAAIVVLMALMSGWLSLLLFTFIPIIVVSAVVFPVLMMLNRKHDT